MALSLVWLLPSALLAKYLLPRAETNILNRNSKIIPEAIEFTDPYNPSLDDPRQIPMERQPEKYRGRIVYARPVQHQGTTDLASTFSDVPFASKSRTVRKMINNKIMYDTSNYNMVLPWDMPSPRIRNRPRFYDNLYDHDKKKPLFINQGAEEPLQLNLPLIKKINKRKNY